MYKSSTQCLPQPPRGCAAGTLRIRPVRSAGPAYAIHPAPCRGATLSPKWQQHKHWRILCCTCGTTFLGKPRKPALRAEVQAKNARRIKIPSERVRFLPHADTAELRRICAAEKSVRTRKDRDGYYRAFALSPPPYAAQRHERKSPQGTRPFLRCVSS